MDCPRCAVIDRNNELRKKYEMPYIQGDLPQELMEDFKEVFGRDIPPMNGWTARTPELRIELVSRMIHDKLQGLKGYSLCPCGCGYAVGCGTP